MTQGAVGELSQSGEVRGRTLAVQRLAALPAAPPLGADELPVASTSTPCICCGAITDMLSLASNLPALWFFTWQDYGPRSSWAPFASPLLYPGSQVRRDNSGTEAVRGFGSRQKSQPDDGSMHPESLISRRLCVGASVCFFATKCV